MPVIGGPYDYFLEGLSESLPKFLEAQYKKHETNTAMDAISKAITPEMRAADPTLEPILASKDPSVILYKLQTMKQPEPMLDIGRLGLAPQPDIPSKLPQVSPESIQAFEATRTPGLPPLPTTPIGPPTAPTSQPDAFAGKMMPADKLLPIMESKFKLQAEAERTKQIQAAMTQRETQKEALAMAIEKSKEEAKAQSDQLKAESAVTIAQTKQKFAKEMAGLDKKSVISAAHALRGIDDSGNKLSSGPVKPSYFSKKVATAAILEAKHQDPNFQPSEADIGYLAEAKATGAMNSPIMVAKRENAQIVIDMAPKIKERITAVDANQVKVLNRVLQFGKKQVSDKDLAMLDTDLTLWADKVASIMQGGGSTTSDFKLKLTKALMNEQMSADTLSAVVDDVTSSMQLMLKQYQTIEVIKPGQKTKSKIEF